MSRDLYSFADVHSHSHRGPEVITNLYPSDNIDTAHGEAWYSVGIHPWNSGEPVDCRMLRRLVSMASDSRVVAIGEAGLDAIRGADATRQEAIFRLHVKISERYGKPLIIHCVRRYGRLMELHRLLSPTQQWVIHGFTGKPELARQLIAQGFLLSFGSRFNPESLAITPHPLHETD